MPDTPAKHAKETDPRRLPDASWLVAPAALAGVLLLARVVWLFFYSDLTLSEDEAQYWTWSLHPDWSYYSKPPGVAWLIRASTEIFGHTEAAIRLPAAMCMALATVGSAVAARWTFPERTALPAIAALLFVCVPAFAVASVLMTIDAPLIACWVWGAAFAARALLRGHAPSWLAFGVCVALGLLFKHTMLLLPLGVLCAALMTRRDRPPISSRAVVVAASIAALGLLPNILWNAANDWPTARHLLGHLALPGGDRDPARVDWSPRHIAEYLGLTLAVIGPVLPLAMLALAPRRTTLDDPSPRPRPQTAVRLHLSIAAAILVFYLFVSLRTRIEGNWPIAAACTLIVPAAWMVAESIGRRDTPVRVLWYASLVIGLLATVAPAALGFLSNRRTIGPYIPIARVSGMHEHAAAVRAEFDRLARETGKRPFILTDHYGRASLLMFYLPDVDVLSASVPTGGRPSQFDLWPATNPLHPETARRLIDRPALLFGRPGAPWSDAFDTMHDLGPLPGEPKPDSRTTSIGLRFKGFPARTERDGQ